MTALDAAGVFVRFPFSAGRPSAGNAIGSMVLSRRDPVTTSRDLAIGRTVHSMTVRVGDAQLQVVAVHPQAPSAPGLVDSWSAQIDALRDIVKQAKTPIALVGDLNASYLNPPYRRLVDAGLRDAHEVVGSGLTNSFPVGRLPIAVMRLDHALVSRDIAVRSVSNFRLPGSDHLGFITELAVGDDGAR
jgi:endonuclease/exonuclease/phosphatase (EEP) superfamily protein YafD